MMNRKYIYRYMLLPLLCLLAGTAGCGNEADMPGDDAGQEPAGGGTYLVIHTRAINNASTENMETYVSSIRVIGFNAEGKQVCNGLHKGNDITINGSGDAATAIIRQKVEKQGVVTLYLIANEAWNNAEGGKGYETYIAGETGQTFLTEALSNEALTEEELKKIIVRYAPRFYLRGGNPFLMTAKETVLISGTGDVTLGTVQLERVFSKLEVTFAMDSKGTTETLDGAEVTELKLNTRRRIPRRINLIGGKDKTSPMVEQYIKELNLLAYYDTDDKESGEPESGKLSGTSRTFTAYLPECIFLSENNTKENAWILSVKVKTKGGRVVENTLALDNDDTDYNIYRNRCYRVNASIPDTDPIRLSLNVANWETTTATVEWSKKVEFDFGSNATPITETDLITRETKTYFRVFHKQVDDSQEGLLSFTFKLTKPEGATWTASLSNGSDFSFWKENMENASGKVGEAKTFYIKANDVSSDGKELTLSIRVFTGGNNEWTRLLLNVKGDGERYTSSGSNELILIKHVQDDPQQTQP